jgi:hypothetical protein
MRHRRTGGSIVGIFKPRMKPPSTFSLVHDWEVCIQPSIKLLYQQALLGGPSGAKRANLIRKFNILELLRHGQSRSDETCRRTYHWTNCTLKNSMMTM